MVPIPRPGVSQSSLGRAGDGSSLRSTCSLYDLPASPSFLCLGLPGATSSLAFGGFCQVMGLGLATLQLCQMNHHSRICIPASKIVLLFALLAFFVLMDLSTEKVVCCCNGAWERNGGKCMCSVCCASSADLTVGPFSCCWTFRAFSLFTFMNAAAVSIVHRPHARVVGWMCLQPYKVRPDCFPKCLHQLPLPPWGVLLSESPQKLSSRNLFTVQCWRQTFISQYFQRDYPPLDKGSHLWSIGLWGFMVRLQVVNWPPPLNHASRIFFCRDSLGWSLHTNACRARQEFRRIKWVRSENLATLCPLNIENMLHFHREISSHLS